jgi:hypothetical protein
MEAKLGDAATARRRGSQHPKDSCEIVGVTGEIPS